MTCAIDHEQPLSLHAAGALKEAKTVTDVTEKLLKDYLDVWIAAPSEIFASLAKRRLVCWEHAETAMGAVFCWLATRIQRS
mgnify:CR=1 FL=1